MRIEAAVLRDRSGPFTLEKLELPEPGPGEVLVEVAGVGFCHTDLLPRLPGFMARPPIVVGHEGAGVVSAAGPGVNGIPIGAHVLLSFDSCGRCTNCASGHPAYCATFLRRNLTGRTLDGPCRVVDRQGAPVAARWFGQSSFATHVIAGARNVVIVDHDLPLHLLGPLGCAIQTGAGSILIALGVQAGASVAIYGVGAVGMAAVMAAQVAGAATIVAVDLHDSRLGLARELGATHVVRGDCGDVAARVVAAAGDGTQYALDTTGVPEVIAGAVEALRPTGTLGLVGTGSRELVLAPLALAHGKNVMGILEGDAVPQVFLPRLIGLWRQGRFPFDRLVRTYHLQEINQAEQDHASGATIKPVLLPKARP